jgi:glucokinase
MLVLAGDIGGTNSRLALYESGRQEPSCENTYPSTDYPGLEAICEEFLRDARSAGVLAAAPERACLGIAGPVEDNVCRATNLPWVVDGRELARQLGIPVVNLVNDFHAAALGSISVSPAHLAQLGGGTRAQRGPVAVLGAGTGLGEAFLVWLEGSNHYTVVASEGGHIDFAPGSPLEVGLFQQLNKKHGRVSNERILSGSGLQNIFAFLSSDPVFRDIEEQSGVARIAGDDPAMISQRASEGSDPIAVATLSIFSRVLGAVAGDLALTIRATGGVFIAGGIAPRILPLLEKSGFRQAFEQKGSLSSFLETIPTFVVTHPHVGLIGAAAAAAAG